MNRNVLLVVTFCLLSLAPACVAQNMTPLLLAVKDAPVPFRGSDGHQHLVYELEMTNFSSAEIAVEKVEVLSNGNVLQTLDTAAVAERLQPVGVRESSGTLAKSTRSLLFLHVVLAPGAAIPTQLTHRIGLRAAAAPPGMQEMTETGGATEIDRQLVAIIGPPLAGEGYISADSCCDATRHTRAVLPVDGAVWVAQRYAVDWEKVDSSHRIYNGPKEKLESYAIFGKPVLAVADAVVVNAVDGEPEQTPGAFPTNIPLNKADGNFVVLDLGAHRYALYAHMQPGSVRVHKGDKVHLGQELGLVGDTGNSIVPHLHFQVTNLPDSLASNGLPYEIRSFEVTGKTPGTAAFDQAETNGTPLPIAPVGQPAKDALPLDQLIISFPAD
jgi:hypothetical protein